MAFKIFLTGQPSIGKTTIIQSVVGTLGSNSKVKISGFYTAECRKGGDRIGFDILYWDSSGSCFKREVLSRFSSSFKKNDPRVGKYLVDTKNVDKYCVSSIANVGNTSSDNELVIVDEVGKMEMLCPSFIPAVNELLNNNPETDDKKKIILGTLPTPRYGRVLDAVEDIRARDDVIVLHVNKSNRDDLKEKLVSLFGDYLVNDDSKASMMDFQRELDPFLYVRPIGAPSMKTDNSSIKKAKARQASKAPDDSTCVDKASQACGPLVAVSPKVLILGETASPLPSNTEYSYCERSMWIVLGRMFGVDFKPIKDISKANKEQLDSFVKLQSIVLSKGICIWDVYADVHESGGERNKRRKKVTKSNANDVASFLVQNPSIHKIAFIGKKAFTSFGKEVSLSDVVDIELTILSSSSPANSRMSVDEKSTQWKQSLVRNIPNL